MDMLFQIAALLIEAAVDEIWPRHGEAPAKEMLHQLFLLFF